MQIGSVLMFEADVQHYDWEEVYKLFGVSIRLFDGIQDEQPSLSGGNRGLLPPTVTF
jgi:hypothetical protein